MFPMEADISKEELEEIGDVAREAGLKLSRNFSIQAEAAEILAHKIPIIKGATVGRVENKSDTFGWNEAIQELYGLKED